MPVQHTWSQVIKNGSNVAVATNTPLDVTGEIEAGFEVTVDTGDTETVMLSVDVSEVQSLFIISDKALTVHTNATDGTGGQAIVLVANQAFSWRTGAGANPLTPDITTGFFVHGPTSGSATVRAGFIIGTIEV